MKRGFTLVELSIVLVIIGLLIGGILVAQSMIGTAKVQAMVREIYQFDAAVANFQTKYNSLPGDSKLFSPAGDGDGLIFDSTKNLTHFDSEIANFWPQLQQSGFDSSDPIYVNDLSATGLIRNIGPNQNVPKIGLGVNSGVMVADSTPSRNAYYVADYSAADVNLNNMKNTFTPVEALAIDQKMDDGLPNKDTGIIIGTSETGGCTVADATVPGGFRYNVSSSGVNCFLSIDILSQSGGLN